MKKFSLVHWAKKEEIDGGLYWLPLSAHLQDTMGVVGFLWEHWLSEGQRLVISPGGDIDLGKRIACFIGAVHDVGKCSPAFATKKRGIKATDLDKELVEKLERAGFTGISDLHLGAPQQSPHNLVGEILLMKYSDRFERKLSEGNHSDDIASIVGGHHGRPADHSVYLSQIETYGMNLFQSEDLESPIALKWQAEQKAIIDWALEANGFENALDIPVLSQAAQVQLLGLLTMSDWIASNRSYFPLIRLDEDDVVDQARRLRAGMSKWRKNAIWEADPVGINIEGRFKDRFGASPYEVQRKLMEVISSCRRPGLFILEAPMGCGKTEAALFAAEELAYQTKRSGVFFGLPTQATSNGIFPRIKNWLESVNKDRDGKIELRLLHGKAHLNKEYTDLTKSQGIDLDGEGGEDSGTFVVNQWFSGKKTAVMDDFVVGTVDQFLMTALKQKHLALRHLGFAKKVVVIDEVHSYDAYMGQYLKRAIEWMASYGVPVILLSATLSSSSRLELTKSYLRGLGVKPNKMRCEGLPLKDYLATEAYPLITYTDGESVFQERGFTKAEDKKVRIERLADEQLLPLAEKVVKDGANLGIVVNTVKKAQEIGRRLAEILEEDQIEVFHSAFLATERVKKELGLLEKLGRQKKDEEERTVNLRPKGYVVVGTQVIEQSLDIDFDVLVSDLAPIDLVIQRLGRLHRHANSRPDHYREPVLYLLGTSEPLDFDEGSKAVYGGYLLARSQCVLRDTICLPGDISSLVQDVYGKGEIPLREAGERYEELKKIYDNFAREDEEKRRGKESSAKTYRLDKPKALPEQMDEFSDGCDLHGWLRMSRGDTGDVMGQSQVRDADESIEVIAVQECEGGYGLFYSGRNISDQIEDDEIAKALSASTIRLPGKLCRGNRNIEMTIHELEGIYRQAFSEWDKSPWLSGSLGLIFDSRGECSLRGYDLCYDSKLGLYIREKEGTDGEL